MRFPSDDLSGYLPEGTFVSGVVFDNLAANGTVFLDLSYAYQVYIGDQDNGDDTFTPLYYNNTESIPFRWMPGVDLEPLSPDSGSAPVVIGTAFNIYASVSTQNYTYSLDSVGNYTLKNHVQVAYDSSDYDDGFGNAYWTPNITVSQSITNGNSSAALVNPLGAIYGAYFRPPLVDFSAPFVLGPDYVSGNFAGTLTYASGNSTAVANLTDAGAPLDLWGMNSLGLGLAYVSGNYQLWLNGNILNNTDMLPTSAFNLGNISLNFSALLPSADLSSGSTLNVFAIAPNSLSAGATIHDPVSGADRATLLIPASLAVDNNRDGNISFDVDDQTSSIKPFRFWINDDDGYGNIGGTDIPQGIGNGNGVLTSVNGMKDFG